MSDYRTGLRHGYEDMAKGILRILDSGRSDAAKLEDIRWRCAELPWVDELPKAEVER